jgi:hypothetical protein
MTTAVYLAKCLDIRGLAGRADHQRLNVTTRHVVDISHVPNQLSVPHGVQEQCQVEPAQVSLWHRLKSEVVLMKKITHQNLNTLGFAPLIRAAITPSVIPTSSAVFLSNLEILLN